MVEDEMMSDGDEMIMLSAETSANSTMMGYQAAYKRRLEEYQKYIDSCASVPTPIFKKIWIDNEIFWKQV